MPSKIAAIYYNREVGSFTGSTALRQVEQIYAKKVTPSLERLKPFKFATWPRWRRCLWMAKVLRMDLRVFRIPRRCDLKKTIYGQMYLELFGSWPRQKQKKTPYKVKWNFRTTATAPTPTQARHRNDIQGLDDDGFALAAAQTLAPPAPNYLDNFWQQQHPPMGRRQR